MFCFISCLLLFFERQNLDLYQTRQSHKGACIKVTEGETQPISRYCLNVRGYHIRRYARRCAKYIKELDFMYNLITYCSSVRRLIVFTLFSSRDGVHLELHTARLFAFSLHLHLFTLITTTRHRPQLHLHPEPTSAPRATGLQLAYAPRHRPFFRPRPFLFFRHRSHVSSRARGLGPSRGAQTPHGMGEGGTV